MSFELESAEMHAVCARFPKIELSYETTPHKKVHDPKYNIGLAIPAGKKCYAWFTFYGDRHVCFLMDLNREKKISRMICVPSTEESRLSSDDRDPGIYLGTIFYGTILEDSSNQFIIEDIFQYSGVSLKGLLFRDKLAVLKHFFCSYPSTCTPLRIFNAQSASPRSKITVPFGLNVQRCNEIGFSLPVLWNHNGVMDAIPSEWSDIIGYTVHHVQYRALSHIAPFINVFAQKPVMPSGFSNVVHRTSEQLIYRSVLKPDYRKPQYRQSAVFLVKADIQADIYRLFAYGRNKMREYVDIAYISNYHASVFMNGIFRKIKENANLDFIEESDDEEEFENVAEDRYVDLGKEVLMEFTFLPKFKKWMPTKIADKLAKVVHIGQL